MNSEFALFEPPRVVTTTLAAPAAPGGVVAVMEVSPATWKAVAAGQAGRAGIFAAELAQITEAGMDGLLVKPVELDDLQQLLHLF